MRNLGFVVALLALGASTFAFLVARDAAHTARDRGESDAAFDVRLTALEQALAARGVERPAPVALPASGAPAGAPTGAPTGAPGLVPATAPELAGGARPVTPPDLDRRLAELEKRLPTALPTATAPAAAQELAVAADAAGGAGPAWVGSVDDAARVFELSAGQRGDMERILADAKRDVDALRKVPDETGATWETVEKDVVKMENGSIHFDGSKLAAFREKVIPGRSESFGGAMRKLREDAARRLKDSLSPAQREKWEKTQTGGLLPGSDSSGGLGFMAFSTVEIGVPAPAEPAMDDK